MTAYVVARAGDIPAGRSLRVELRGRPVAVFNVGGDYFALVDRCPHKGASLACGAIVGQVSSAEPGTFTYERAGEFVRCPWHGWEYDLRTGQSYCDPDDVKARQFPARREPGARIVKGPYVAETLKVTVADDYIVVEA